MAPNGPGPRPSSSMIFSPDSGPGMPLPCGASKGEESVRSLQSASPVAVTLPPVGDDVEAIKNLIYSYAELLDTGDIERLAALFADATVRTRGTDGAERELQGAEGFRRLIEQGVHLYDGIPGTKHLITNVAVEVGDDGRTASARSYYVALQARPELPLQPILAGRWHDRFERDGDRWRFADRVIFADLVGDTRFHLKSRPE